MRKPASVLVFSLFAVIALVGSFAYAAWEVEGVEERKAFRESSVRIDAGGKVHLAYGRGRRYYATFSGGSWQYEIVDSGSGVGAGNSLALDSSGHPVISCGNCTTGDLKLARWHDSQAKRFLRGNSVSSLSEVAVAYLPWTDPGNVLLNPVDFNYQMEDVLRIVLTREGQSVRIDKK
jgi:hypothetical protein